MLIDFYNNIQETHFAILKSLENHSGTLGKTHLSKIRATINASLQISTHFEEIAEIPNEIQRNRYITNLTKIQTEPSFAPGIDKKAVLKVLKMRVETLINTYQTEKNNNNLQKFFSHAFQSDPCLNGRFLAIQQYTAQLLIGDDLVDDTTYDDIAIKFSELMYGLSSENPPENSIFIEYLKDQKDYNTNYKHYVESENWITIYNRAKEFYI